MALLEMRDVHLTYRTDEGPVPAVRGVNLSVDAGEIVGVAGESGCGKSTLVSTVLRLFPKTPRSTGEVLVGGEDVLDHEVEPRARRALGRGCRRVPRRAALAQPHSEDRQAAGRTDPAPRQEARASNRLKKVRELLEQVGLPARHADAYPHQLSGGQKQRVMIALALTCDPAGSDCRRAHDRARRHGSGADP